MKLETYHALPVQDREQLARSPLTGEIPLSSIPENWRDMLVQFDLLERVWASRPCLVCQCRGRCVHREPDFDAAEILARNEALKRSEAA